LRSGFAAFGRLVAFPHTLFALPFALIAMLVAANGLPSLHVILLVFFCMVTARNAAMAFNRLVDRHYDAANPRTASRTLPVKELTPRSVALFVLINSALFVAATLALNRLVFVLSPVALGLIFLYSFTKRFTWLSHLILGTCLAIAPFGAWAAVRGSIEIPVLFLCGAVALWVGGFDILYSLQDEDFDRATKLHSIPARWGSAKALWTSRGLHGGCMVLFGLFGVVAGLSTLYFWGLAVVAVIMSVQHFLVRSGDLSRMGMAFFTVNGWVSLSMLFLVSLDYFLRS
jgi:4-hydroxybenzoate polyprenyltransferase